MTVYVDDLARYPTKIPCFRLGSCHMMADTLDELHAMAVKIGLKRAWFQARERRTRRSCAGLSFTEKGS